MPSYSLSATESSVTFHITPDGGYTYYRLFLRRTDSADMILSGKALTSPLGTPLLYTVNGLEAGTEYTANVYYSTDSTTLENIVMGAQTITTDTVSYRPSDWVWTTNIAQGAAVPQYDGVLAPITAQEWNAFGLKINAFRQYQGLSSYTFTTVTQGAAMTAAIIGEAIEAIDGLSGHGTLPTPYSATLASFWLDLAAALNAVP